MQKLDVNGNLIHSSFSSNDPNAAALTPQRIQETRKDSRRSQRELPSEYFDQQSEEEYYPNYSVSQISNFPTGLPVYQTRSHERIAPRIAENQPRNPYHSNMIPLPSSQPYFEQDDYVLDSYMQPHYGPSNENSHVSHSYGYSNPRIASGIGRSSSSQGSSPQSQSPAPKNTLGQNATSYGDEAYNYQSLHEPTYSCYPQMYQA